MISSLRLKSLALERGGRVLFRGLSACVTAGEALAVTGANGAGKTSLLRAVAGLLRPLSGEVVFDGMAGVGEAQRRNCHLVGHHDGLKGARTALEELVFQARWCGATQAAALVSAERVGLTRQLGVEVRRLSAGQRRRLALARLISAPRSLWLLDEPLAPLDAEGRALMGTVMVEHLAGGGIIVAAVHDPLPIAARVLEIGA